MIDVGALTDEELTVLRGQVWAEIARRVTLKTAPVAAARPIPAGGVSPIKRS